MSLPLSEALSRISEILSAVDPEDVPSVLEFVMTQFEEESDEGEVCPNFFGHLAWCWPNSWGQVYETNQLMVYSTLHWKSYTGK